MFGWQKDNSERARKRKINGDTLLDNLMLFPPDKKSKWCIPSEDPS